MLRRLRAIADQPAVAVILLLLAAADLWCIGSRHHQINTAASGWLFNLVNPRPGMDINRVTSWHMYSLSDELLIRPDGSVTVPLPSRPDESPWIQPAGWMSIQTSKLPTGLFAATRTGQTYSFHATSSSGSSSVVDASARQALVERINRETLYFNPSLTTPEANTLITTGVLTRGRILPLGYLHNTLSLIILVMLCWSLRLNIPKVRRALRRLRRRDPTRCPHCGYSTVGLPSSTCPECGHTRPLHPSA